MYIRGSFVVCLCVLEVLFLKTIKGDCSVGCDDSDCLCDCYHAEVRCSNKSITSIFKYPSHMDVHVLELDHNHISEIPYRAFKQKSLVNLLGLRLSANRIKRLRSKTFENLLYLEMLFLNHNYIEDIAEDAFVGLKNLKRLYLNDNRIKSLPVEVFEALKNHLRLLYLQGNKIEHIPLTMLQNFHQLQTIDVSRNKITKMDGRFFAAMPSLQNVLLKHNPWSCDAGTVCSTIGTFRNIRKGREEPKLPIHRRVVHRIKKPLIIFGGMMCASPIERMGLMAESLIKSFKCHQMNLTEYFSVITVHDSQKGSDNNENNAANNKVSPLFILLVTLIRLMIFG